MYIYILDMDNLQRISQSLFALLCGVIGSDVIVHVRRTATNLQDNVTRMVEEAHNIPRIRYFSGSKAEGFRFRTSDDDWMYVYRHIRVIPTGSYASLYENRTSLLMMENEMTKQGFTLLRLIQLSREPYIQLSTVPLLNGVYISSKVWREEHTAESTRPDREFTHGPCTSGTLGELEYDMAFCLQSDIWPIDAHGCIKRLHQCGWPSHDTIISIINDGVLFVAIGAKQSYFENIEWRNSFSLAEKKLRNLFMP